MRWLTRQAADLFGTVFAALSGIVLAQGVAFANAYLQRIGGHIDEAKRTLSQLSSGNYAEAVAEPASREKLATLLTERIADLEAGRAAIEGASPFLKPLTCLFRLDLEVAGGTLSDFTPAIPLDTAGIVYGFVGIFLGWALWRLVVRMLSGAQSLRNA